MAQQFNLYIPSLKSQFEITHGALLGSKLGVSIHLPIEGVAPEHLLFRIHNGILSVTDLGSPTGTQIAGKKVIAQKSYILDIGDELIIANTDAVIVERENSEDIIIEGLETDSLKQLNKPKDNLDESTTVIDPRTIKPQELDIETAPDLSHSLTLEKKSKDHYFPTADEKKRIKKTQMRSPSFDNNLTLLESLLSNGHFQAPNLLIKMLSSILSLLITASFFHLLISKFNLHENILSLQQLFGSELSEIISRYPTLFSKTFGETTLSSFALKVTPYLTPILFYITTTSLSIILLGRTLGELFCSISYHNGFLNNRILGLVRFTFAPILSWTVLGTLPTLINKRSLLDMLTLTKIQYNKRMIKWSLLLGLIITFLPLNTKTISSILDSKNKTEIIYNENLLHAMPTNEVESIAYSDTLMYANENIVLFPTLSETKNEFLVLNFEDDTAYSLKFDSATHSEVNKSLSILTSFNPFIPFLYPSLFSLNDHGATEKSIYDVINFLHLPFSISGGDYLSCVTNSFDLFMDNYLTFANKIASPFPISDIREISFVKKNDSYFMKQTYWDKKKWNGIRYLPLSLNSYSITLTPLNLDTTPEQLSDTANTIIKNISLTKTKDHSSLNYFLYGNLQSEQNVLKFLNQIEVPLNRFKITKQREILTNTLRSYLSLANKHGGVADYEQIENKLSQLLTFIGTL